MEAAIQKIMCPICDAGSTRVWRKEGYYISRCLQCRSLFIENPPPDTTSLYGENYFFGGEDGGYGSYDLEKEAMRSTFEHSLARIRGVVPTGRLFDVGAATGYFLSLARAHGYEVSGIDISAAAAKVAGEKGIDVAVGTLESISYPNDAFDVVTMFDVIEHVASPRSLLGKAHRLIRRGGVVFGSTPDSLSINARIMGKRWHLLCPPEHLVLLNGVSLRIALAHEGFEVLWTGRILKWFSIPYILQTAGRWLGLPILGRIGVRLRPTWIGRIALPLDLHDNIFFLAKKRA